jgi:phytoene dehydrogenase-like protein
MTRDQLRALWLHRAVAAKVAADPARVLAQAKSTASRLLAREPDGAPWLRQWLALLDRGPEAVMRTLVSTDPLARELRANSPFAGVLSPSERASILTSFSETASSATER